MLPNQILAASVLPEVNAAQLSGLCTTILL